MKNTAEYHDYLDGLQYGNPAVTADSVYKEVTDALVREIESGRDPYKALWKHANEAQSPITTNSLPINFVTRKRYSGGNIFQLLLNTQKGFTNEWLTAAQAKKAGGKVSAGEKPTRVIFVKVEEEEPLPDQPAPAEPERKAIVRAYLVYNSAQCEGLKRKGAPTAPDDTPAAPVQEKEDGRIPTIDKMIATTGAHIEHKGNKAFYSPAFDEIVLPPFNQFIEPKAYYSVAFHELGHWTGAAHRLNRKFGDSFGSVDYCFEELVAETCSALCMFSLNLPMIGNNAAYMRNYFAKVKGKPQYRQEQLWRAMSLADRAYRAILPEYASGKPAKKAQEDLTRMTDFVVEVRSNLAGHLRLPVKAPANRKFAVYGAIYSERPIVDNILEWRVLRTFEDLGAASRYTMRVAGDKTEDSTKKHPKYIGLTNVADLQKP
jgi:antirestriction protein ArdC